MAWLYLIFAGLEEVVAVMAMKYIGKGKKAVPITIMVVGFAFSFFCLSQAMQTLPPGVAYAVWAGIGTVGITLAGLLWFKEKYELPQFISLGLLIIGIIGLKLTV
ncbi:DMT family transporter [Aneurinibacillus aneurinilyticus]|jgi:quaternary ammonium compound-resistance protein SugE|uniref:Multidrug efflux SMR transporter n=2 Tax=Aneurinibacillus aneurinilyticus TaxID=1391 RepID=A0A848CWY5_ANEAE|nr:multidrug efflux SMR transporter [Aneurinibacillus aneurinilyticus]ERI06647.1 multidrug resistance protein, SMR family [Aneurinibacillus aneurinilyticus ATCC 12856]MCI1694930.1 multidrug efflux SMR transporter [Aneurinibacillus aneurinilyticus]MED0670337.1 multidrug efflux SMR transporter [Aneurinibacillus aneurinilyticus]MED0707047.1 multidrug efflux SMR transporter [Aneurinibacillus aneurinilyticus]MED0723509.1 multidrug efflux SMR transporter [Aneurinibacillus aneurinilyticus]